MKEKYHLGASSIRRSFAIPPGRGYVCGIHTNIRPEFRTRERCGDGCRDLHGCAAALQPDHTGRRQASRNDYLRDRAPRLHMGARSPVYEKATNNDRVAVRTACNDARAMVGKKK